MNDGKIKGYLTFELKGSKIKITASDSRNHSDTYTTTYKLEKGVLKMYVDNGVVGATAELIDKDHLKYMNTQVGMQVLTRQK